PGDQHECGWHVRGLLPAGLLLHFVRQTIQHVGEFVLFRSDNSLRDHLNKPVEKFAAGRLRRQAFKQHETRGVRWILRGQRNESDGQHGQGRFLALSHDQHVAAALPPKSNLRGSFDGVGSAKPHSCRGRKPGWSPPQYFAKRVVLTDVGGSVSFENKRARVTKQALIGAGADSGPKGTTGCVRQPPELERTVPFHTARNVVVNAFART